MPPPLEEQEGLGDRRVVQEPLQTLSSPHLGCGAVSTYLSARSPLPAGLPSTSPPWVGFSPLLPALLIPSPSPVPHLSLAYPSLLLSPATSALLLEAGPHSSSLHSLDKEAVPCRSPLCP